MVSSGLSVIIIDEDEVIVKSGVRSSPSIILRDTDRKGILGPLLRKLLESTMSIRDLFNVLEDAHRNDASTLVKDLIDRGIISRVSESPVEQYLGYLFKGSSRLSDFTVTIAGTGVLGTEIAVDLLSSGIGNLVLYDGRQVKDSDKSFFRRYCEVNKDTITFAQASESYLKRLGYKNIRSVTRSFDDNAAIKKAIGPSDFLVVSFDVPNPRLYYQFNRAALQYKKMWMISTVDGHQGHIGPTFVPFYTACYADYELQVQAVMSRLETHRYYTNHLHLKGLTMSFSGLPSYAKIIAGMTSLSIIHQLLRNYSFTNGRTIVLDFNDMQYDAQDIHRFPRCPFCNESVYSQIFPRNLLKEAET